MDTPLAVEALGLERTYASGRAIVAALAGVTLGIRRGEFVAVMGPSGSGKSTLLNVVAGLERPTGGAVRVDGEDLSKLDEEALARHRSKRVGMVFQAFNLLPRYRVVDNVALPLALIGDPAILLADEPTGNLDSANGAALIALFEELHSQGQTVLLVTHDAQIAAHAERTIHMRDGRVVDE